MRKDPQLQQSARRAYPNANEEFTLVAIVETLRLYRLPTPWHTHYTCDSEDPKNINYKVNPTISPKT
jgi:hypothetical protein